MYWSGYAWTSQANQSYTTLTSHFTDEDWNFVNLELQTRHTPESHTAENLKDLFEAAFTEWNIQDKTVTGVVDNAKTLLRHGFYWRGNM